MKRAEKTKKQLIKEIVSLQKQKKKLGKLGSRLKHKHKELKEFDRTLEERVHLRTSAERIVHKQLHNEIEQRKGAETKLYPGIRRILTQRFPRLKLVVI